MDGGSKSGSKTNLNESSVPLLDEDEVEKGETPEKENIELKEKASTGSGAEKDDSDPEKKDDKDDKEDEGKGKKKKDKKKKEKKEKVRTPRTSPSVKINSLTTGLNLLDRDERKINDQVDLDFEEILAEPSSTQGFDGVWRLTFLVFSSVRLWSYRILSAIVALPCAILWGLLFSLLAFVHVWLISPSLKVFELFLFYIRKVWQGLVMTCLEPVTLATAALLSRIHVTHKKRTIQEAV